MIPTTINGKLLIWLGRSYGFKIFTQIQSKNNYFHNNLLMNFFFLKNWITFLSQFEVQLSSLTTVHVKRIVIDFNEFHSFICIILFVVGKVTVFWSHQDWKPNQIHAYWIYQKFRRQMKHWTLNSWNIDETQWYVIQCKFM